MPAPSNILEVFRVAKSALTSRLASLRVTVKSCGTGQELNKPLSEETGYWTVPGEVGSKPPRWIVHLREDGGLLRAGLASAENGDLLGAAATVGYINNRDDKCAVVAIRIKAAAKKGPAEFTFPESWEWLAMFVFKRPLPAGTSGDALTSFDPIARTLSQGANERKKPYPLGLIGLVKCPGSGTAQVGGLTVSYDDATTEIAKLLGASDPDPIVQTYDGNSSTFATELANDAFDLLTEASTTAPIPQILPMPELLGVPDSVYAQINAALQSGKRHIVFYGPPGTGKTTIAQYVAEALSSHGEYEMLTASSSWTGQDIIGGYQPKGGGAIGFVPGAILRNFDRPVVIDELNRCPIDKVIGPLFSVLSNQATTLPYKMDVGVDDSPFHVILPTFKPDRDPHEWCPSPEWRILATLNTVDKSQLGQISYALSRRFAWIKVGIPENLPGFVKSILSLPPFSGSA